MTQKFSTKKKKLKGNNFAFWVLFFRDFWNLKDIFLTPRFYKRSIYFIKFYKWKQNKQSKFTQVKGELKIKAK